VNTIRRKKVGPQAALECVNTKLQRSHYRSHYKVHLGIFTPAIIVRRGNPFQLQRHLNQAEYATAPSVFWDIRPALFGVGLSGTENTRNRSRQALKLQILTTSYGRPNTQIENLTACVGEGDQRFASPP
jgi:hypothetical protein